MRKTASPLLFSFLLMLFPLTLEAGHIVYLKNSRIMYVDKYESQQEWTILEMEGGGKVKIRVGLIDRIEEGKNREADVLKKSETSMKVKSTNRSGRSYMRSGRSRAARLREEKEEEDEIDLGPIEEVIEPEEIEDQEREEERKKVRSSRNRRPSRFERRARD